jgi:hypothetical protein
MAHPNPYELGLTAWIVLVCFALLVMAGLAWHGLTAETFGRVWQNLVDRPSRQMAFRFALQPTMAAIFAISHGLKDARNNRTPYFWTIVSVPEERAPLLREGLNATARIVLIALVIDTIYQVIEFDTFYPGEVPIIALLLAFLPYVVLRGLVARIARYASGKRR